MPIIHGIKHTVVFPPVTKQASLGREANDLLHLLQKAKFGTKQKRKFERQQFTL